MIAALTAAALLALLIGWGFRKERREWQERSRVWQKFAAEKQLSGSGLYFEGVLGDCRVILKDRHLKGSERSEGLWYGELVIERPEKMEGWVAAFREGHPPLSFDFSDESRVDLGLPDIEVHAQPREASALLADPAVRRALDERGEAWRYLEARDENGWVMWALFDDREALEAAWRLAEAVAAFRASPYR